MSNSRKYNELIKTIRKLTTIFIILFLFITIMLVKLLLLYALCGERAFTYESGLIFKKPPEENQRCGICPTYFEKLCAFNFGTNETFIFDNVCIMDLYNCIHGTDFTRLNYENCLYFGNFAYVHGFKHEDYDYGEDHFKIVNSKKNPDFAT